jgi:hypothetical protein
MSFFSGTYEKYTFSNSNAPSTSVSLRTLASSLSGICGSSLISSNILAAHASAFWSSVTTPEISLNGFVYWLA